MKKIVILGSGAGGTMIATKLRKELIDREWQITIIDKDPLHHYQPGWLFIPFGIYTPQECVKPKADFIPPGVNLVVDEVVNVDHEKKQVKTKGGQYAYDWLVIATGCRIVPEETDGLMDDWRGDVHDYYSLDGAMALYKRWKYFKKGRVVLNIADMPIKCPVAPLEFVFLADWFFKENGVRDDIEIELVTPLGGAFTKPVASKVLGDVCEKKNIKITPNWSIDHVNAGKKTIESVTGDTIPYDLLVSIPLHSGARVISDSGLGDPMGFVNTDKGTLKAADFDNIFVIGDATNVPTSKSGAVAHYESDIVVENILLEIEGQAPKPEYDGHST
ncbi:MAG: NAD(P)/FAD-dependent oxidoreductase [Desulfobacterales bacterium]|nr:NAD(P)/FAD-dependent oxidoreductase [Desulfobacterales bacterium]